MDRTKEFVFPAGLSEIDAPFMTAVLRRSGVIVSSNEVVSLEKSGVGMTAGYFSDIKRMRCAYRKSTGAQDSFVAKAWPTFEILPKDALQAMFPKDIRAYHFPADQFHPRPQAIVADADATNDRWALVMDDAETFADHKVHEQEMIFDEVLRMVPRQVGADLVTEFPDELWLVQLPPVGDPAAVADAVATALAVTPQAGLRVSDSIAQALSGRQLLILLDNYEHLLDADYERGSHIRAKRCTSIRAVRES